MDWAASIAESGFAVWPGLLSRERIDRLLTQLRELPLTRSRAGVRHGMAIPAIADLSREPQIVELARQVLGVQAFPFRATVFDKSSRANWLVVWHQDTALPLRSRKELAGWGPWSVKGGIDYAHAPGCALSQVLALRVSLDDSNCDNGPLRVLPGTHNSGVLSDDQIHELASRMSPVDCICPKGGVVAMRPLLVHASSKSRTEMPRRVLHIEYAASDRIADPLQLAIA